MAHREINFFRADHREAVSPARVGACIGDFLFFNSDRTLLTDDWLRFTPFKSTAGSIFGISVARLMCRAC